MFGYNADNYARWGIIPDIPNVLYYRIYAPLAGPDFYFAAKLLNAAFMAGTAAPAYAVARRYVVPWQAAMFAAFAISAPIATFVRYFMPETLYCFGFWVTVYVLLRTLERSEPLAALATGVALALLSLVKPHALALVVAVCGFFLLRPGPMRVRLMAATFVALFFYATRVALVHALTGRSDYSVTGPAYHGPLAAFRFEPAALVFNAVGHLATLCVLVGLPLGAIGLALRREARQLGREPRDLMLLALCTLTALIAMTVYFSFGVYKIDPVGERITRLHGRYYVFALPLAILAYATLVRRRAVSGALVSNQGLLSFGGMAAIAGFVVSRVYETGVIDYPDLGILARWPHGLVVPATAIVVCMVTAFFLRRHPGGDWSWRSVLPIAWWATIGLATSSLLLIAPVVGRVLVPDGVDRAMVDVPELQRLRHRGDGLIVGTPSVGPDTFRVMFYLASMSRGRFVADGATLGADEIPPDVNWLILLQRVAYSGPGEQRAIGPLTYIRLR